MSDLWTLQKDEWVSCFVRNVCVNCLNWNQPNEKIHSSIMYALHSMNVKSLHTV